MWLLFIQLTITLAQSENWECGGDRSVEEVIPDHKRHLLTRSSTLSPIRIYFSYYNFDLNSPDLNTYFYNSVMPAVKSFLSTSLKVYPVQNNLVLSSTNCLSNVIVPNEHKTVGVDADMIIYVGVDSLTTVSYVAFAGSCERESTGLNNVLAGTIIINIPKFSGSSFSASIAVITHEITHILGFSSSGFNYWKTPSGTAYATDTLKKTVSIRGATKTLIVTPNVVAKAREAFGCGTLEGIELEEYGGSGTAGSHWDKRIMMNDYMTGYVPAEPIWSTITFAALEDSGWYTVDYTLAVAPLFGKIKGCEYFNNKCLVNGVSTDTRLWCDTQASWTCDVFALNKGTCQVSTYSVALPLEYQYYPTTTLGGSDAYADYCPYRVRYSNGSCRGNSQVTATLTNSNDVIGINSRCFESTLVKSPSSTSGPYSACYEVISCSSTSATIKIGTQTLACPFTGGSFTVTGYTGLIKCPASNILCEDVPCLNLCYGRGVCSKGFCVCLQGFSGNDCSLVCGVGCLSCDSNGCLVCQSQYSLLNGACSVCSSNCLECSSGTTCTSCSSGYYIDNGSCTHCVLPCLVCSNLNTCISCASGYIIVNEVCVYVCPSNCVTCSATQCYSCSSGYYLDTVNSCASCPSKCLTCDSNILCTSCIADYVLVNGVCTITCQINCNSCTISTICSICSSGYFLSSGSCFQCISPCSTCSSSSICLTCVTGYILVSGACILSCPSNCQSCSSSTVCLICNSGFYLSTGNCPQCISPCFECSSSSTCLSCISGYSLVNGGCIINCPSNCQLCSSNTVCTTCSSGFFLSSGICIQCISPCLTCSSSSACLSCVNGYSLSNGVCIIICPLNCQSCLSNTICTVCNSGYYLSSGLCVKCLSPCSGCTSSTSCLSCIVGYYLTSSACAQCPSSCTSCTSSAVCSGCISGYVLYSGVCKQCSTGCSVCSSPTKCTTCTGGYRLANGSCVACSANCLTCTSSKCTKCMTTFTLSGGKCI